MNRRKTQDTTTLAWPYNVFSKHKLTNSQKLVLLLFLTKGYEDKHSKTITFSKVNLVDYVCNVLYLSINSVNNTLQYLEDKQLIHKIGKDSYEISI